MDHKSLGKIVRDEHGDGSASVPYGERMISIRIMEDELSYEAALEIAATIAERLAEYDAKMKQVAAADLTETYNGGWNEYDEAQEDGTFKTVVNPKLTPEEFAAKLTLRAINVTGQMLDFFYDDQNMFWGHSVIANSMDGLAFTEVHGEIFG